MPGALLQTESLGRDFGGVSAVRDVTLTLEGGVLCAIIGPNGAGKSTLFKLLTGLVTPSRGRILFKGENITGLPPHAIAARGIGQSFQLTSVFPNLTVFENVRLAAQSASRVNYSMVFSERRYPELREKTSRVLDEIRLADRASQLARMLPYGARRVLELGLILAREPSLVLLDEPTAGVSHEEIPNVVQLIGEIASRRTVILIEHNMDVVWGISRRVIVMCEGRVLADGRPEAVKADPEVQRAYLGSRRSGATTVKA